MIQCEGMGFRYNKSREILFHNVSIYCSRGDFRYVYGHSGSGKTTFLNLLTLNSIPTWGKVIVHGLQKKVVKWHDMVKAWSWMGQVNDQIPLIDHISIVDNVALPLHVRGLDWSSSRKQAWDLLKWLGISHPGSSCDHISDGERQRVLVARAVIGKPTVLLADEPTQHHNMEDAVKLMYLLRRLNDQGTTVIMTTYDERIIKKFPHPVWYIHDKTIDLKG